MQKSVPAATRAARKRTRETTAPPADSAPSSSVRSGTLTPLRTLIAAHSHPLVSKGGAEIAAFELFERINALPGHEAWFLGCQRDQAADRLGSVITQPFSEREYLYSASEFDWFNFANRDVRYPDELEALLGLLAPDVIHFHHYVVFGVETFLIARRARPNVKIVVTLHEYLAICHHFGQMVTKTARALCYESAPDRCNRCFPEIGRADFFLRKQYISRFLELVDHFIAPSHFLAERYIAWGLPAARISVIENIVPPSAAKPRPISVASDEPLRVGFFGQISALKGINVLLDTGAIFESEEFHGVVFEVFGDHRGQPPEFQAEFLRGLAKAGRNIRYHGPYEPKQLDRMMQTVDLVLMPSIWWENSPLVIQEALRNRRPVVCSDIGGMAEKVRDGIDGFHFPAGSSLSLAALLRRLAGDRRALARVSETLRPPLAPDATVQEHLDLYRRLLATV